MVSLPLLLDEEEPDNEANKDGDVSKRLLLKAVCIFCLCERGTGSLIY